MPVISPLTASVDLVRNVPNIDSPLSEKSPLQYNYGIFADDVVNISSIGIEKQQKEMYVDASSKIEDIASEVIRISSTIGKARSVGNLTSQQANELYNKIAKFI